MKFYLAVISLLTVILAGCSTVNQAKVNAAPQSAEVKSTNAQTAVAGAPAAVAVVDRTKFPTVVTELIIRDEVEGDTKAAVVGSAAVLNYTGWIYDANKPDGKGKRFDGSRDAGVPFSFLIGVGKVIAGWDQGIIGMKIHGRRTLIIPPHLAYAEKEIPGKVPANSTLLFEMEMVNVLGGGGPLRAPPTQLP